MVFLLTAISTALAQDCDRNTACVDGQPLINCSMVDDRDINVYILENIPRNSVVYCLDDTLFFPDDTKAYAPVSESFRDHFRIDSDGTIVVEQSPNYEEMAQIASSITGRASNNSIKQVFLAVNVINVNEVAPELKGGPVRSFILTEGLDTFEDYDVNVVDTDGTQFITFNITGVGSEDFEVAVVPQKFFNITVLRLKQGVKLDRENNPVYQLTIIAVDNLEPVKYSDPLHINVTVKDINDNAPQFTDNRTFTIPTGIPAGEIVGIASASDPDAEENGTVTYNITGVEYSMNDLFIINSTTGVLYTTEAYTDHMFTEEIRNISVEIAAKDNGDVSMNSTAIFFIILQRPPQFSNDTYVFSLEENNDIPFAVGNVSASFADEEDSVSFYYEVESSAMKRFTIDDRTGEIRALMSFDRETSPKDKFTVMAIGVMDQRLVSTATVRINVLDKNDQYPQFAREEYNFEIRPQQQVAGRIHATDNDVGMNAVVNFSATTDPNIVNINNIGNNTAEIIVIDSDRITGDFVFRVIATDIGGLQNTTRVTLIINRRGSRTNDENMTTIIVAAVTTISIAVILFIVLIIICLCWRWHRNRSGQFPVNKQGSSFNGFATTDSDHVPTRKKSILKVPTGDNGKFGSPSCSEAASERVKFEPRANMVMFELDQPTIRREASITTDTKLGSGDDSSICSGHNKHADRDEGLVLRSRNTPPTITTMSSNMTDSDDEDDFPSISGNQLYPANNIRTQPPQPAPLGVTNHAYSPPLPHQYNPVPSIGVHQTPPLVNGAQMLSSENLDRHNRAMAKRHRKVPSDQYSETSDGTGTYFTSDAEDGSAYGEPPATWTSL